MGRAPSLKERGLYHMSLLGRLGQRLVPKARPAGASARRMGTKGGPGSEEFLFGEAPGPRKWASWEAPWYFSMGSAFVVLYFGLAAKPNTDLRTWARQQALA